MSNDKRTQGRVPVVLRIKLRYQDVGSFIDKFATNVSRGGMFISSRSPKPVGTEIKFELRLADATTAIAGTGRVKWVRAYNPDNPRQLHGMGIEFTTISDESRVLLERIVEHRRERGLATDGAIPRTPKAGKSTAAPKEEAKAKKKAKAKAKKKQPEAAPPPDSEVEAQPEPEGQAQPEPDPEPAPQPEPQPEPKPEPQPEPAPEPEPAASAPVAPDDDAALAAAADDDNDGDDDDDDDDDFDYDTVSGETVASAVRRARFLVSEPGEFAEFYEAPPDHQTSVEDAVAELSAMLDGFTMPPPIHPSQTESDLRPGKEITRPVKAGRAASDEDYDPEPVHGRTPAIERRKLPGVTSYDKTSEKNRGDGHPSGGNPTVSAIHERAEEQDEAPEMDFTFSTPLETFALNPDDLLAQADEIQRVENTTRPPAPVSMKADDVLPNQATEELEELPSGAAADIDATIEALEFDGDSAEIDKDNSIDIDIDIDIDTSDL